MLPNDLKLSSDVPMNLMKNKLWGRFLKKRNIGHLSFKRGGGKRKYVLFF